MLQRAFIILGASLWFLLSIHEIARPEIYPFKNYSYEDGLPNSYVFSIIQDRAGFIWFGTNGGACKFDGKTFISYTVEDGLTDNIVWSVCEDKFGDIWFGTNRGICKFDGKNFVTIVPDGMPARLTVYDITRDSQGNLWFATGGDEVAKFDGEDWTIYTSENGLASNEIQSVMADSHNNIWIVTRWGEVSKFDRKIWTIYTTEQGILHTVTSILEDKTGALWLTGSTKENDGSPPRPAVQKITGEPESGNSVMFTTDDGLPAGAIDRDNPGW